MSTVIRSLHASTRVGVKEPKRSVIGVWQGCFRFERDRGAGVGLASGGAGSPHPAERSGAATRAASCESRNELCRGGSLWSGPERDILISVRNETGDAELHATFCSSHGPFHNEA